MEKKMMKSNGAGSRSSAMKRRRLLSAAAVLLICCLAFVGAVGAEEWYDPTATEYIIDSKEDLLAFAEAAKDPGSNKFEGKTVYLNSDIDLNWADWYPFNFYGTFYGNYHTIKNINYIPNTDGRMGFFQSVGGLVRDLTLDGIKGTVPANGRFGGFARYLNSPVENIHVKNIEVTTTDTLGWVGGFTTYTAGGSTKDCSVTNLNVNAENGADLIGGFISLTSNRQLYSNSDVTGFTVNVVDTHSSGCGVGGFVAQTQTGWNNPKMKDCDITGIDITASGLVDVGGFIAWPGAHTEYADNCHTQGRIDASGVTSADCFAGGFLGNLGWNCDLGYMGHLITDCTADVDIITKVASAGGFVGSATNSNDNSMYATFNNCVANGDVTCVEGGSAPVGGFAGDADRGDYTNCVADGVVTNDGSGFSGGFIGEIKDTQMKYDNRYPSGTRPYLADVITFTSCDAEGSFVGKVAETKPAGELVYEKTIFFDLDGGSGVESISAKPDATVSAPENPTKTGYTFKGWNPELPTTMPSNDLTVTAVWEGNKSIVSFDSDGGTPEPAEISVTYGSPYGELPTVEKENYQFSHWKDESENEITSETLVETDNDHRLTAVWIPLYNVTVTVIPAEGGSTSASSDQAVENSEITLSYTESAGYKFVKWNVTEGNVEISDNKFTMPACDVTIEAVFEIIPSSSGSGSGGDGGALSFPRTTTNGGLVDFGSSKVVKALMLPEGSSGSVLLKVDTVEKWPKALETEYTFDISVEKLGDGMAYILFEIPVSTLDRLGITPADIGVYHLVDEVWVKLAVTYEVKDGMVCYEAATDSFSPFKLVIEEGAATQKEEENVPTVPPTEEPDVPDEPEILPPIDEPTKPADEPETPAPILAVLAGLGAAFIVRRK